MSRYGRVAPTINLALCEAVDRIVQHREQRGGGGGGVASPTMAGGAKAAAAVEEEEEAGMVDRGGRRETGGGGEESRVPPLDTKEVAMRLCALIDSCDGRPDELMADPRARAELESIFPGLEEREFRNMLGACLERRQVSALCFCLCLWLS